MSKMEIAKREAEKSTFRQRLGAVIVKGGAIISTGYNSIRYSSRHKKLVRLPKYSDSMHAERNAILKALNQGSLDKLVGSTIYVTRVNNRGHARLAKPCKECMELIQAVGIKKVIYTDNEGTLKEEI